MNTIFDKIKLITPKNNSEVVSKIIALKAIFIFKLFLSISHFIQFNEIKKFLHKILNFLTLHYTKI